MAVVVCLAGRSGLEIDGLPVRDAGLGQLGRVALAFLVSERHRPVDRHELAEVLWGERLPATWESALRTHVTKLRGMLRAAGLPSDVLVARRGCYELDLPDGVVVDVEAAAADLEGARTRLAAGDHDAAGRSAAAAATVAGRHLLPGAGGAWVERRRAEIHRLRVEALEVMAEATTATGEWATAVRAAEEAVALEPLRESAYVRLMAAHAAAGRRGEALRAYGRCRRVLAEELGVDPSPATEAAYITLLGEGRDGALAAEVADDVVTDGPQSGVDVGVPARLTGADVFGFVSRAPERQVLDEAWAGTAIGTSRLVLVGGEPGAGKTRLAVEVARDAHRTGAAVLWGSCDDGLAVPFQPFAQALRQVLDHVDGAVLERVLGPGAGELVRLVPELAQRRPGLPEPRRADPETERFWLFEAVAGWLGALGTDQPVLFVLDDLQWATAPTVLLVRHLLQNGRPDRSLAMIGTYRDTEIDARHPLGALLGELGRLPGLSRLSIGGLDPAGIGSLAADIADHPVDHDGRSLVALVHQDTGGNPLYAGELLRHLDESGRLRADDGTWAAYRGVADVGVPEGLSQVIRRRTDRLSDLAGSSLRTASVIGASFDLDVLAAATGADEDQLLDALDEGLRAKLITEERDRPGSFSFSHAIVQAALSDDLTRGRRSRLHLRIADAIEALGRHRLHDHTAALARHYLAASPLGDPIKAGTYALDAGLQAADQLAFEQAAELFRLGLSAIEGSDDSAATLRCELLIALADASRGTSETKASAKLAADLARSLQMPVYLAQAASAYCREGIVGEPDPHAVAMFEAALAVLGDDHHALRAMVLASLATYRAINEDQGERADHLAQAAVQAARSAHGAPSGRDGTGRMILWELRAPSDAVLAYALIARACVLAYSTRFDERRSIFAELDSFEQSSGISRSFEVLPFRVPLLLELGDAEAFRSVVRDLRESPLYSLPDVQTMVSIWDGGLAMLEGRFGEMDDHLQRVLHHGLTSENKNLILSHSGQLFNVRRETGDIAEIIGQVRHLLADNPGLVVLRAMLAWLLVDHGELREAADVLSALAADDFSGLPRGANWTFCLTYLSEVAARVEDSERAEALYRLFLPHAGHVVVASWASVCQGATDRYLGMLAATSARWETAEAHFETALTIETSIGAPPLLARTQYWFARMLLARHDPGDRERANELLRESGASASTLGMKLLAAQAQERMADRLPAPPAAERPTFE